jgi:hypothetical protein
MKITDYLFGIKQQLPLSWRVGLFSIFAVLSLHAQTGPFSPSNWPPTINSNAVVDYLIVDPNAVFSTPPGWTPSVGFPGSGGDETYQSVTLGGLTGDQATSSFLNPFDVNYTTYESFPVIDVLIQVYGNDSLYNADGTGKSVSFLEGTVTPSNNVYTAQAGTVPGGTNGANNSQWNWMLFEITNQIDSADGARYVGDATFPGDGTGGVNGGTLRIQGIGTGLTIRAIAFGPQGAFGTTNQINVFAPPLQCTPEPPVNLAFVDINQKITNYLTVVSNANLGETYTVQSGVGPANDLRTAIQATSGLMNFAILSNYLGQPCNPDRAMKVCLEFYDDPALTGVTFGPAQYSTDSQGDAGNYSGPNYTMTGTGQWVKVAFWIAAVNLEGVNTAPLTGGPTVAFNGANPFIDRIELGVVRTGTNALAGLDPDPSYHLNPLICTTNYGYYAEWDPHDDITNNVTVGSSGGDQQMVVQLAGPTNDLRLAEAPAPGSGNNNIQFSLLNQAFGPNYQDNADVFISITYYDDPALAGATVYPGAYYTMNNSSTSSILGTPPAPYNTPATLKGTGKWVNAIFEIPNDNFTGVNQGPQAVVRFQTTAANPANPDTENVFISRVRFDVVRPCGPLEGINMFQSIGITSTNAQVKVNWYGTATVQAATNLLGAYSNVTNVVNTLTNSYSPIATNQARFFRLEYPPYPSYLSTNPIHNTTP